MKSLMCRRMLGKWSLGGLVSPLLVCGLVGCVGSAEPSTSTPAAPVPEAQSTNAFDARVDAIEEAMERDALAEDVAYGQQTKEHIQSHPTIRADEIDVQGDARTKRVELRGEVESAEERQEAVDAVKARGAAVVDADELVVVGPKSDQDERDADLRARLTRAVESVPRVTLTSISVEDGRATIRGEAQGWAAHEQLSEVAFSVTSSVQLDVVVKVEDRAAMPTASDVFPSTGAAF